MTPKEFDHMQRHWYKGDMNAHWLRFWKLIQSWCK